MYIHNFILIYIYIKNNIFFKGRGLEFSPGFKPPQKKKIGGKKKKKKLLEKNPPPPKKCFPLNLGDLCLLGMGVNWGRGGLGGREGERGKPQPVAPPPRREPPLSLPQGKVLGPPREGGFLAPRGFPGGRGGGGFWGKEKNGGGVGLKNFFGGKREKFLAGMGFGGFCREGPRKKNRFCFKFGENYDPFKVDFGRGGERDSFKREGWFF